MESLRRLINKEWTSFGSRIRVECNDLGAELLGPLHCGHDRIGIARGDRDCANMPVCQIVDELDLRLSARLRRTVVIGGSSNLFSGYPGACQGGVIVWIGRLLNHHRQLEIVRLGRSGANGQQCECR